MLPDVERRPAGNRAAQSDQASGEIKLNGSASPRQHASTNDSAVTTALRIPDVIPDDLLGAALAYAAAGWFVGPLDMRTKHPGSVLGKAWPDQTFRDFDNIDRWFNGTSHGLFLHVGRSGAIAFDVDHPELLPPELSRELWEHCAPNSGADGTISPPFQSTRVDEPQRGHYLYSAGGRQISNSTKGFGAGWGEICSHNAVIVVQPTEHSAGGRYQWVRTGVLPALPALLAERCRDIEDVQVSRNLTPDLAELLPLAGQPECDRMRRRREKLLAELTSGGSRHEAISGGLVDLVRFGTEHPGVGAAIQQVRDLFVGLVTADKSRSMSTAASEWDRSLTGALAIVGADPGYRYEQDGCIVMSDPPWHPGDPLPSQIRVERADRAAGTKPDGPTSDLAAHEEFWDARPELGRIRDFARARIGGPWAALGVILMRVATVIPPQVTLPPIVGGKASLNQFCALVAAPGGGKGNAERVAAEMLRLGADLHTAIPGSGEGLVHQYRKWTKDGVDSIRDAVLFSVSEVDTLITLGGRQGSTLMSRMRAAWSEKSWDTHSRTRRRRSHCQPTVIDSAW